MCPHELWPTSVNHPFSFLNASLGLTGMRIKCYKKIIHIFRPVFFFKILFFLVAFLIICAFLSFLLTSGL